MKEKPNQLAFMTCLIYGLVACLWILFSDKIVNSLFANKGIAMKVETFKGWAFVLVTALLLFFTLRNQLRRWEAEAKERKKAELELCRKKTFLEAMVESSPDGVIVVDNGGKKIFQNQMVNKLWKIPQNIAENTDDSVQVQFVTNHTKNPKQFLDKITYLYSHPNEISRDEVELVDGTILDRYSAPVNDRAGKYYGRIWTFRNVTDSRRLEEQFRQSQKMEAIGQLAGGVAHDFNNILAVIQIQADMLKVSESLSTNKEFASEISAATQRASALTRQLLLLSRKQTLKPRNLDLNQSVNDVTKMLRRVIGENIQLHFKFTTQRLFLRADAGMIDQVLMNLAVNARDAMPEGGELTIETSAVEIDEASVAQSNKARAGSFVRLSVSDTGCGIPDEILPKIFDPFFTTKDIGKGTGLGLATVLGIVQQHQGWINIESKVGHGTTFHVYFPRLTNTLDEAFENLPTNAPRGGDETILLVEDDAFLRDSVNKALSRLGYRVLEAVNGVEAVDIWKRHRNEIGLLLTDIVMPGGITGKDLGQRLLTETPGLKVVFVSGYNTENTGKDFPLEEGVNFLVKPFKAHKLAQIVRKKLDEVASQSSEIKVT